VTTSQKFLKAEPVLRKKQDVARTTIVVIDALLLVAAIRNRAGRYYESVGAGSEAVPERKSFIVRCSRLIQSSHAGSGQFRGEWRVRRDRIGRQSASCRFCRSQPEAVPIRVLFATGLDLA